jgi:hypothetical protein
LKFYDDYGIFLIVKEIKYAAVGSRETPENVLETVLDVTKRFAVDDLLMRSGGAEGFDQIAEIGCNLGYGKKEIFLPEKNHNNNKSEFYEISDKAYDIASKVHPAWYKLNDFSKKLIARNTYQVLGYHCDDPVDFIFCWTKDGKKLGGTAQALRLADLFNIRVFNMGNSKFDLAEMYRYVDVLEHVNKSPLFNE